METKKSKILIVDDSVQQIEMLTDLLIDNYEIISADSGYYGIELAIRTPQPDLILLDIMMPDPDGYEVCKILSNQKETKHIPIILISGIGSIQNEYKGLQSGAVDYIHKPYNMKLISVRIENHLQLSRQKDKLEDAVKTRTKELKMTQALLIDSLGILAEYRDPETGGHIKRTQNYVNALAKELNKDPDFNELLTEEDIQLLHQSAPLHDIGKVAVPDSILCKKGKLNEMEYEKMKEHSIQGYYMLKRTMGKLPNKSFFKYALEIAHTHHEKWDGSGYPQGLKNKEIPLSGRIMALADVYDALVNTRYYKEALSHVEAKKIITEQSGKHFDPQIVQIFLKLEQTFLNISSTYSDKKSDSLKTGKGIVKEIRNILIVDDDEINREILRNQLVALGYTAEVAEDGFDAMSKINQKKFDIVLSDLDMPKMNGYELSTTVNHHYPELPIIALTASDYKMNKTNMKDFGFSDYLLKPVDDETIKKMLCNFIDERD